LYLEKGFVGQVGIVGKGKAQKTEKSKTKSAAPQFFATFTVDVDDPNKDLLEVGMSR
jgi:hypothetical protein